MSARPETTGARVYLHSPTRRQYVATVLAPVVQELAGPLRAERIRVTSGWRFGPHFDLRADAHRQRPIDWDRLALQLARGSALFPAGAEPPTEDEYLRSATMLGQIEGVPGPYGPRRAHGETELLAADTPPVGHGPLKALRAQGQAHLLAPLVQAAATESGGALLVRVAEAFLALADSHPHGVRFGTFSFRSHAEAFFHWAGPTADYRAAFERRLGKDRAVLEELVRRVKDGRPSDAARGWQEAFNACRTDFRDRVTDEDLERAAPSIATVGAPTRRTADGSAFHAAVTASGVIDQSPAWFAGYRLTINLFYQLLPALDVNPVRRFYLCHALAETVDAVFEESWQSRLAAVATLAGAR